MIIYQIEKTITTEEFTKLLVDSTLAERGPVGEPTRIDEMLKHANLIITARDNGKLIGIARSLTDFVYCTYLSDLAVAKSYQKVGIGKELIKLTKQYSLRAKLILLSASKAVEYYPKIGMKRWEECYVLEDINDLR